MLSCLVFVESNTSGTGRLFARAATRLNLRPVLLTDNPSRYPYAREDELEVLQADTNNVSALLEACRQLSASMNIRGVMSSSDYYVEMAATLAQKLGLSGADPVAVAACRDKQQQRVRLGALGDAVPRFLPAASVAEACEAAGLLGMPVVVKPVSGSGSVGVKLCSRLSEVAAQTEELLRHERNERGQPIPRRVLVEALATGPEYSVEAFSGQVIGVTHKHLGPVPHFVEVGHDFPAQLTPSEEETIRRSTSKALDALRLNWGPTHTELRLTPQGPKIIEVNPRLAGGYIPELVRMAFGIDLIFEFVKLSVGIEPDLKRSLARHASIRFLLPEEEGTLSAVAGLEVAALVPHVLEAKLSQPVGSSLSLRGDFRDRAGYVLACADDAASARQAAETARRAVHLHLKGH